MKSIYKKKRTTLRKISKRRTSKKITGTGPDTKEPSKFVKNVRTNNNALNSEDFLYDVAYGNNDNRDPNETANIKIAYNTLVAKNLNKDEQPLHSGLIPHRPFYPKPETQRPFIRGTNANNSTSKATYIAGRKSKMTRCRSRKNIH
jgi:hypothetical protein